MGKRKQDTANHGPGKKKKTTKKASWLLHTPCQIQCLGPSQVGKCHTILQLLKNQNDIFDEPFRHVIYAAPRMALSEGEEEHEGERQDSPYMRELVRVCQGANLGLTVSSGLPQVSEIARLARGSPTLMILDDILCFEPQDLKRMVHYSNRHTHHLKISVLYTLQNPFQKNPHLDLTTLSRNCTGRFLFYQTNDWRMLNTLNSQLFPDCQQFLTSCLLAARSQGYNYIFVNTAPQPIRAENEREYLPRRFMCYTRLLGEGEEGCPPNPLFFDLRNPPRERDFSQEEGLSLFLDESHGRSAAQTAGHSGGDGGVEGISARSGPPAHAKGSPQANAQSHAEPT